MKFYGVLTIVLILLSYWFANVLDAVTVWTAIACFFTGVLAIVTGVFAIAEWRE